MRSILLLLLLSSCALTKMSPGSDLDFCTCENWKTPLICEESEVVSLTSNWWEDYRDPCLNNLEQQAIQNNYDLAIAASRIFQARAALGIASSQKWPHLNLDFSYSRESALVTLEDFGLGSRDVRIEERQAAVSLDLCYQIDFWGKFRNLEAAARESFFASAYNRAAVFVALTSDVGSLYFTLRTLDEEILYLQKAIDVRREYRDINVERLKRGLDSEIDVTRSNLDLALAEREYEETKRVRVQTENALALLLGIPACSFCLPPALLPDVNLCPLPELPSSLLVRRPDIQQKMHLALSQLHEIGVAKADFFPQFSITGAAGTASPLFSNLFTWQSRFWALAVNACQILFDGGRLTSKLALRKAEYLESLYEYRKQIVLAFMEVENALNEINSLQCQFDKQEKAVLFSQDTALLARHQYDCGLCNYLLVADEEKTQLNTRVALIRLHGSLFIASVQLIKALGGGFPFDCP